MKKRILAVTFILTVILTMFSLTAVFAGDEDDYGADAHSGSMSVFESEEDYNDLSFKDMIINTVVDKIRYVIAAVAGIIVLIIVIKLIGAANHRREPKYKGRH